MDMTSKEFQAHTSMFSKHNNTQHSEMFKLAVIKLTAKFTEAFGDPLSNKLNPKPIRGESMTISLESNAEPKNIKGACRVPLRYEKGAGDVVEDII